MLSLNSIISGGLRHTTKHFNLKLENFSGNYLQQIYKQKDSLLTIPTILLFYLKKKKNTWKMLCSCKSGLGHSMHSDELYNKSSAFLFDWFIIFKYSLTNLFSNLRTPISNGQIIWFSPSNSKLITFAHGRKSKTPQ
jgi:hypothetical protein